MSKGPFRCPVCGYDRLSDPPKDFHICPCCGIEFGYQDARVSHRALRADWINEGCKWFSQFTLPPHEWSAGDQINNLIRDSRD